MNPKITPRKSKSEPTKQLLPLWKKRYPNAMGQKNTRKRGKRISAKGSSARFLIIVMSNFSGSC